MLNLKLDVDKRFLHDEVTNGKARIKFQADPALEAVGVFSLHRSGNAVDAAVNAHVKFAKTVTVTTPSQINATFTANVKRLVTFNAGVADTGIELKTTAPYEAELAGFNVLVNGVAGATKSYVDHGTGKPATLQLTVEGLKGVATVELVGVQVATGTCEDPLCNGAFYINPVGEAHVDALCNWARYADLKHNETRFNIRAMDPHTKVITLQAPAVEEGDGGEG
jgi:hypothetical protein